LPVFLIVIFSMLLAESVTFDTISKYIKKNFPNKIESKFKGETININISGLIDFYNNLSVDEQPEQIADWALYATMAFLKSDDKTQNDFLKDKLPMRIKNFRNSNLLFYDIGRFAQLSKNEYIVVLPKDIFKQEAILIRLLDENRKSNDFLKGILHIIEFKYETNLSSASSGQSPVISISYQNSKTISEYFKEEKGYFSKVIRNMEDFNDWFLKIDDLTYFKVDSNNLLILGGRRIGNDRRANITANEISAIYKSYNRHKNTIGKLQKTNNQQYEGYINYLYSELLDKDEKLNAKVKNGTVTKTELISFIKEEIPFKSFETAENSNIGFSLDPKKDLKGFAKSIREAINDSKTANSPFPENLKNAILHYEETLKKISEFFERQISEKYFVFRRQIEKINTDTATVMSRYLESLDFANSYQAARYDGPIKGTELAMNLFYTDLTAKIWALDFESNAPQNITGFIPLNKVKVPKLYWEDSIRLSSTRLWFGVKQESYDISADKKIVHFEPIATRIYAASSDPLYPGKESEPNYQSAEFLGWWDKHYAIVADYEPEYHKLNQIQKWSVLFNLTRNINSNLFSFLRNIEIENALNFETWYRNNNSLKCKVSVPFVDSKKYNAQNECLSRMSSQVYWMMGQQYFYNGGVSLSSDKELLIKMLKNRKIGAKRSVGGKTPETKKPNIAKAGLTEKKEDKKELKFKDKTIKLSEPKVYKDERTSDKSVKMDIDVSNSKYGSISARQEKNGIMLIWTDNQGGFFQNIIDELIKIENRIANSEITDLAERVINSSSFIENNIRIENGKRYLVKFKNKDFKYGIIGINEQLKKEKYPIKSSGTEVFSNIYGIRIASQKEIKQYLGGQ